MLWTEEVTIWQEHAYLSSLYRISNWTYIWPKNIGANGKLISAEIFMANKK